MKKENILKALKKAKEGSQKRNFKQSFDLIINLKGIDNKKAEHQIDDLDQLLTWFNTKLTGGEASEWVREPSEEELKHLEQELLNKIRGKNK